MASDIDTAVVFCDRLGSELRPLFSYTCPALVPIAGKTPLEFCLDDIASASLKRVIIVLSRCAEEIQSLVGTGEAWGVEIEYVLSRGEEGPQGLVKRFKSSLEGEFIALRGDVLRGAVLAGLLNQSGTAKTPDAELSKKLGLVITDTDSEALDALEWPLPGSAEIQLPGDMESVRVNTLSSLDEYRMANLDVLEGLYGPFVLPGLEIQKQVRVGRLSHLPANTVINAPVILGDHASVHKSCSVYGPVCIGDNCFIDKETQLSRSVILPDTYIGAGLDVKDAIVGEGQIIHTREDITIQIDDPLWVAPMEQKVIASDSSTIEQGLAALLLVITLPLNLLACFISPSTEHGRLQKQCILGNKRGLRGQRIETNLYHWSTTIPILRGLPGLLGVMRGHLRLFGTRPQRVGEEQPGVSGLPERHISEQPPAGLVSPAYLYLDASAPPEETELFEIHYAAERSLRKELNCLFRSLLKVFSGSAWRAAR